jgi:hypothetical protein
MKGFCKNCKYFYRGFWAIIHTAYSGEYICKNGRQNYITGKKTLTNCIHKNSIGECNEFENWR